MLLATVLGSVTATRKADTLGGFKFLLLQPRDRPAAQDRAKESMFVAVDLLGAGIGEDVIVATGRAARIAVGKDDLPVDAAVIGIVDGTDTK